MRPATFNNLKYNLKMNNFLKVCLRKQKSKSKQLVKLNNLPIQHIIPRLVPFTKTQLPIYTHATSSANHNFFTTSIFNIIYQKVQPSKPPF